MYRNTANDQRNISPTINIRAASTTTIHPPVEWFIYLNAILTIQINNFQFCVTSFASFFASLFPFVKFHDSVFGSSPSVAMCFCSQNKYILYVFSWVFSCIVYLILVIEHFVLRKKVSLKMTKKKKENIEGIWLATFGIGPSTHLCFLLFFHRCRCRCRLRHRLPQTLDAPTYPCIPYTTYQWFTLFRTDIFWSLVRCASNLEHQHRKWCTDGTWRLMMIYFRLDVWQNTIRAKHK